jgi:hypothetical protein
MEQYQILLYHHNEERQFKVGEAVYVWLKWVWLAAAAGAAHIAATPACSVLVLSIMKHMRMEYSPEFTHVCHTSCLLLPITTSARLSSQVGLQHRQSSSASHPSIAPCRQPVCRQVLGALHCMRVNSTCAA